MRPIARLTLIPRDAALVIAARGPLSPADADRLAAICLSLPRPTRALELDLTGAGLVGAAALRRVSRAASSWRYARAAPVTLRFLACRYDDGGEETADEVPVEVRYLPRVARPRQRAARLPAPARERSAFHVAPRRLALHGSA